ncbi:MAG TPA: RNA methyltransferase [Clostridia bacterium]
MEVITSRSNQTVKLIKKLDDKKYRKQYGLFLVEGRKMIEDCIRAGYKIEIIAAARSKAQEYQKYFSFAPKAVIMEDSVFEYACQTVTPQGVLAAVKFETFSPRLPQGDCVVLDGVSDAGNVGAIIRTSAAAGIKDVYLINCADAYSPKSIRSTMGGIFFVNVYDIGYDFLDAIAQSCELIGADMYGENYLGYKKTGNTALIIGSEANGLSNISKQKCKRFLSIPMQNVESLNAAVSAGILIYYLKNLR